MTAEELIIETVNPHLTDIGNVAPELANLFIAECCSRTIRVGRLTADKYWRALAAEAHTLKRAAKTYILVRLGARLTYFAIFFIKAGKA